VGGNKERGVHWCVCQPALIGSQPRRTAAAEEEYHTHLVIFRVNDGPHDCHDKVAHGCHLVGAVDQPLVAHRGQPVTHNDDCMQREGRWQYVGRGGCVRGYMGAG
jgi:hypothetical protein